MRPFTIASIFTLLGMAAWHAVSLYLGWDILIGAWLVPLWLRWLLLAFTAGLAALLWQESFSFRHLTDKRP